MSLLDDLGIEVVERGRHKVVLKMELTQEHLDQEENKAGSINAVLSETAASIGANLNVDENDTAAIMRVSLHSLNKLRLGTLIVGAISVRNGNNIQTWQATTHFDKSAIENCLSTITLKKIQI
ncbi:aromatic compound catabolic protein [Companilactobacillus halodurans]|uniref:Aromatic compound catabolic protein n=1 Tax=Companilactobacillus halodurans TaxID=2584183 RepID=A0A5P0ZS88_9LACO|nr:aromatic compound catabolic protein [Companilactobacillus halodurans]MQS76771.1 aromatic compound catabolic protein [Companilactobacillus halodurans]MQS98023.1 aromatic compound catabolic protein [Companilactobacillus halodurans]